MNKDMAEKDLVLNRPTPDRNQYDLAVFGSIAGFEAGQRMAKALCHSPLVPDAYKGEQNIGSCLIALDVAARLGQAPLVVFQHLYVVKGKPSWAGQFVIALINSSGLYKSKLKFEEVGERGKDTYGLRAYAYDWDGDKVLGPEVTIKTAISEGWWNSNKKWQNMTSLMLRYRSAAWFARVNCPEVMLGLQTREEIEDVEGKVVDVSAHEITEINPAEIPVEEVKVEAEVKEEKKEEPQDMDF